MEHREEITPELLRILEETVDRASELDAEGDYMAHLYAMFLLAQFCETRAYPVVVHFACLPGDLLDSLCCDFITEDLGQMLASVCSGNLAGIQSLIDIVDTDQWVRGAALSGLVTLVAAGQKSRDEIVRYFAGLFRGKLARQWSHVWDTLVSYSSDLYPAELLDDIERAYNEGGPDSRQTRRQSPSTPCGRHCSRDRMVGVLSVGQPETYDRPSEVLAGTKLEADAASPQIVRATLKVGSHNDSYGRVPVQ